MRNRTTLPGLTGSHVVEYILHSAAMWQDALRRETVQSNYCHPVSIALYDYLHRMSSVLSDFSVPPFALVSVEQEDQLLLYQFPLFRGVLLTELGLLHR